MPIQRQEHRTGWAVLAVAVAVASALAFVLTRGTSLGADEYWFFIVNRGLDPRVLLSPHAGNLILLVRVLYAVVFGLAGPDYLVLRIIEPLLMAAAAVLVAALLRGRVGPLAAALLAVPLLFMGAAGEVILSPLGINIVLAVDFGLAALLALERRTGGMDLAACVLLTLSVCTFSVGLAFTVAAGVIILLAPAVPRRLWVVGVPVAVYLAWRLLAPVDTGPGYLVSAPIRPGNLVHLPDFAARAAAAAAAAETGLYLPFGQPALGPLGTLEHPGVGFVLVISLVVALAVRGARSELRRSLWPVLALGLAFWGSVVLVLTPDRFPNSTRYLFTGAVVVLLLAGEALRPVRWRALTLAALVVASGVAVGLGITELVAYARTLRAVGRLERAGETGMDVARGDLRVASLPMRFGGFAALVDIGGGVRAYLTAAQRWGSPGFSLGELTHQSEPVRAFADAVATTVEGVRLVPSSLGRGCRRIAAGAPTRLGAPGAVIRAGATGAVFVGRFATHPGIRVGVVMAGRSYRLGIPVDGAARTWSIRLPRGPTLLCALSVR